MKLAQAVPAGPALASALALASTLAFTCIAALAFPEGATAPATAEIETHLTGKVFNAKLADGNSWRLEYQRGGYFFVDTARGGRGSGRWRAENGRLCSVIGNSDSCNEVRLHQECCTPSATAARSSNCC